MAEYQVVARRYRPKRFSEVVGQDAIVATIKNAVKFDRIAHAYLFCGSRGTGKTTLARLFAKLLNCENPGEELEPCNECASCKEIASGSSLDVLEIDGASNRGIEDVRQINETVGYTASRGGYKIYIIDEVHMLTGAAFNALLKTLEEPPPKVKFFFATTEPHKVLPTILSRCQRFNLSRIPEEKIVGKLTRVAQDMQVQVAPEALQAVARVADGGMRDAESILDQIISFSDGAVTLDLVNEVLGLMPQESFFSLDAAGKKGDFNAAFALAAQIFSEGKEISHYVEELTEHFRNHLLTQTSGQPVTAAYQTSAQMYTREQLLTILDRLVEAQEKIRFAPSQRVALEMLLLRIIRSHQQIPVEALVRRLADLEQSFAGREASSAPQAAAPVVQQEVAKPTPPPPPPVQESLPFPKEEPAMPPAPKPVQTPPKPPVQAEKPAPTPPPPPEPAMSRDEAIRKQSQYDTVLQFAAVELDGTIQKKQVKR